MEHDSSHHDSSHNGYHEPEPGSAGLRDEEDWGDDFPKTFSVNLIWAEAHDTEGHDGAIGYQGSMPWHLPEDLKHFQELTISHPVIMGRKTWESLPAAHRPLPNRDNIVISGTANYQAPGASVVQNLDDALDIARQEAIPDDGIDRSEIWVIGGARVFEDALKYSSHAFVTQLKATIPADTYAPDLAQMVEAGMWHITSITPWRSPKNPQPLVSEYRYLTFEKHL